ncbi:HAMP domain-containing sensor histidine kinase [Kamptonema animale CS-326]|jgi:two-component system NarL family sensor kinase|uniref:sensor histidine kinase n=1 Tax=Kamptonema animale TaxID=92934 RepID=UPI00232E9B19|nr:HAMP domain-containing sensor histidine kinase [Kamptonema animale]MDB9512374.1 HAMP domain-containing sensor histidine kinase [Kamptonema animale CS-326]
MLHRLSTIKKTLAIHQSHLNSRWLIVSLFVIVAALEFATPADYVFGYLYTGPILLANSRFSRLAKLEVVLIAWALTLLNLFVPHRHPIQLATVANRLIAVMALGVTGWLSDRNQQYQEAIAQAKAELQSQQRLASMREDFVSTLSHDLKTPMLGAIETIKAFQQGKFGAVAPAGEKVLEMMARSHRTTLQLVETLLDVYRNDSEGLNLKIAPVNLVTLAEEVITELRDLSASRRVYIDISYGASDFRRALWVNGDALQLVRVFSNLLTNGINHSPRGGKVDIIMESDSAYQIVKIIDIGAGITDGELPYLFERFYQGHSHRQAKGSGLGLYLSRQIIEAHGGIIWAENRLPHGALFGFRLPAIPPYETCSSPTNSTG